MTHITQTSINPTFFQMIKNRFIQSKSKSFTYITIKLSWHFKVIPWFTFDSVQLSDVYAPFVDTQGSNAKDFYNRWTELNHEQYEEAKQRIYRIREALPNKKILEILKTHELGEFLKNELFYHGGYFSNFIKKNDGYFSFNVLGHCFHSFIHELTQIEDEAFGPNYFNQ